MTLRQRICSNGDNTLREHICNTDMILFVDKYSANIIDEVLEAKVIDVYQANIIEETLTANLIEDTLEANLEEEILKGEQTC